MSLFEISQKRRWNLFPYHNPIILISFNCAPVKGLLGYKCPISQTVESAALRKAHFSINIFSCDQSTDFVLSCRVTSGALSGLEGNEKMRPLPSWPPVVPALSQELIVLWFGSLTPRSCPRQENQRQNDYGASDNRCDPVTQIEKECSEEMCYLGLQMNCVSQKTL